MATPIPVACRLDADTLTVFSFSGTAGMPPGGYELVVSYDDGNSSIGTGEFFTDNDGRDIDFSPSSTPFVLAYASPQGEMRVYAHPEPNPPESGHHYEYSFSGDVASGSVSGNSAAFPPSDDVTRTITVIANKVRDSDSAIVCTDTDEITHLITQYTEIGPFSDEIQSCDYVPPLVNLEVTLSSNTGCPEDTITATASHNITGATILIDSVAVPLALAPASGTTVSFAIPGTITTAGAYPITFTTDAAIDTVTDVVDFTISAECANLPCTPPAPVACFDSLTTLKRSAVGEAFPACTETLTLELFDGSAWSEAETGITASGGSTLTVAATAGMKARYKSDDGTTGPETLLDVCECEPGGTPGQTEEPVIPAPPTLSKNCAAGTITVTSPAFVTTGNAQTASIEIRRRVLPDGDWIEDIHVFATATTWEDEAVLPAMEYEYSARACNDGGCSAWSTAASISLISSTLTMTFTQPAPDSSLRDVTELLLQLTDAGENVCEDEPVTLESFFDGNEFELVWQLISGTPRNGVYRTYWDAREFPSGAGVLRVTANGRDDCRAKAELPLVLDGMTNPVAACWWSKKLPTPGMAKAFPTTDKDGNDRFYHRVTPSLINPVRALDDADNYVYSLAVNAPGDSTDIDDYQPLTDKRHSVLLGKEQTFRVAMCRQPLLRRLNYPLGAQDAIRLHAYNDGADKVAILTHNPNALLSFDGNDVTEIADLSEYSDFTPIDAAFLDGRFYVAMAPTGAGEPHLRVIDLDDADRPYRLLIDEDGSPLTAIAAFESKIWIATTTAENEATIYSFGGGDLQRPVPVASLPPVVRFQSSPTLRAACEGGGVYLIAPGGAELEYSTNQDSARALYADGAMLYAGTGDAGKLFANRGGNWGEEKDFAELSQVRAIAPHRSSVFAAGDSPKLFQRRQGVWGEVDELIGATAINDMVEFGDLLVMATSNEGGEASLHARRVASGSGVIAREIPQIAFGLELTAETGVPIP